MKGVDVTPKCNAVFNGKENNMIMMIKRYLAVALDPELGIYCNLDLVRNDESEALLLSVTKNDTKGITLTTLKEVTLMYNVVDDGIMVYIDPNEPVSIGYGDAGTIIVADIDGRLSMKITTSTYSMETTFSGMVPSFF